MKKRNNNVLLVITTTIDACFEEQFCEGQILDEDETFWCAGVKHLCSHMVAC